jgi:transposase-like protein
MTVLTALAGAGHPGAVADQWTPRVPERARRRAFTAQFKLDVLAEYDAAGDGEKGAVLRRHGLYSSHLVEWRRAWDTGALAGLSAPRGRPPADPRDRENATLRRRVERLERELAQAQLVIDVQGKVSKLLETLSESTRRVGRPTSPLGPSR